MKSCPYCGSTLNDAAKFCVECGKLLPETAPAAPAAEPAAEAPVVAEPVMAEPAAPAQPAAPAKPVALPTFDAPQTAPQTAEDDMPFITTVPPRKQMLSTFQYIALSLLYGLPVIGLVFLFVFGAGHPKNVSLKRFSSAMLILRLTFWIVLFALLMVAMIKNGKLLSDALGQLVPAVENLLTALLS